MSGTSDGRPARRATTTQCVAAHNWVLVLAAGEGSRLQCLTTTAAGLAIPKQFCSLRGGSSLLHDALLRARAVAPPERICTIVAREHQRWWCDLQRSMPADNVIVQPRNRGTANGILLPLLEILHRDPQATLLVLPSDHCVRSEAVLAGALQQAMAQVEDRGAGLMMLGFAPEDADPELGYVLPCREPGLPCREAGVRARKVERFIEKPSAPHAREIIERGGLWNAFIFAVSGRSLIDVFEQRHPLVVAEMRGVIAHAKGAHRDALLVELYERLPVIDFSRDIMEHCASRLRVITVPPCGWSDLGTPRRVAEALQEQRSTHPPVSQTALHGAGFLDLAVQYARTIPAGTSLSSLQM